MAPRHYGVPHPQVELDPERERAPDTCLQPTFKQNGGFKTHQGTGSRCLRPPPHSHQGNSWAPSSVRRWTTRFQGRPKGRRRASAWRSDPTCFEAPTQWTHSGHMESDGIGKLLITADVGAASSSRSSRLSASAGSPCQCETSFCGPSGAESPGATLIYVECQWRRSTPPCQATRRCWRL